jgi:hypothetical protein
MPSSEDPPLSEYQQTVQDFIALLQALRAWRRVIHLYYQGRMIGRLTVNFAELMKKSSSPRIALVDHFDDDPNIAVWPISIPGKPAEESAAPPAGDSLENDINAQADQATQHIIAQGQADAAARSAAIAQQFARTEAAMNAPIPSVFSVAPLKFGQGYDSVFGTSLNVSGHPVDVGGDDFIAYEIYRPYPGLGVSGVVADEKGNAVVASGVFSGDKDADGHYILVPATPEQRAAIEAANAAAVPAITDREIALNAGLALGGAVLPALRGLASPILRGVRAAATTADEALTLPKPTGVMGAPVMPEGMAAGGVPELPPDSGIPRPGGGIREIDPRSLDSGTEAVTPAPPPPDPPIAEPPPEPVGGPIEEKPSQAQETNSPPADGGKGVTKDADSGILKKENIRNNADFPDGLAFRADLADHLAGPDGFTSSGKLFGTHNLDNAVAELNSVGATYNRTPTGTPGIYDLKYAYKNAIGKTISGAKTVYDPAVYSDQAILEFSQSAGQSAFEAYLKNPSQTIFDVKRGGIKFRSYINIDPATGIPYVGNIHPIQ